MLGPLDWVALSNAAPSIIVALMFAAFALVMRREDRKSSKQTMVEWRQWFEIRDEAWRGTVLTMNEKQDSTISRMIEQHSESTARLAEEIKAMTVEIRALAKLIERQNELLIKHDVRTAEYIESDRIKKAAGDKNRR